MDKRTEYYQKMDEEAKANLAESEKVKEEYSQKLVTVEDEISAKKEKARKELEEANNARIKAAEAEAAKMIDDARGTIQRERAQMLKDAQEEISDMVTTAAEKLVVNASTSQAYDEFLDTVQGGETHE